MKYTLVNKNKLIPTIINFTSEKSAIRELIEITNNYNNPTLFKNVYIYASDYNEETEYIIFNQNNNIVKKNLSNNNDYLTFFNIDNLYNETHLIINPKNNTKNIFINENNEEEIILKNEEEIKLKNEKDKIKKSCEDIFALYNMELSKIKKIENNLKNLEKKEDKLNNRIINHNIDIVNKLYYDYKTFLKIKEKIKDNSDKFTIPELFIKKYVYFNELLLNQYNSIVLDKLKTININEPDSYLSNNDIILFSKKYLLDSKNLNCSFDHNWDDLTGDTEGIIKPKGWSARV
jgi:hypothetical protein